MAGVIGHIPNPDVGQAVGLARAAETAGASWIGLADAFWWRDVWMLLTRVAAETERIEIGPAMTNPYLRHHFHTAAALATLQEVAPGRVFCGLAAGGSELSAAAGVGREDAASRIRSLVAFLRDVSLTAQLDEASGCELEVPLHDLPVLIAGRGNGMLRAAGAVADRVLLWAIPASDLSRSVSLITAGAADRSKMPELIWAPLVRHGNSAESSIMHVAVYASLNTTESVRAQWGFGAGDVEALRDHLVRGDLAAATELVPEAALVDLVFDEPNSDEIAELAKSLGVSSLAVPGFAEETVGADVRWATNVERKLT